MYICLRIIPTNFHTKKLRCSDFVVTDNCVVERCKRCHCHLVIYFLIIKINVLLSTARILENMFNSLPYQSTVI